MALGERSVWLDVGSAKTLVLLLGNGDSRKLAFQIRNLKIDIVK